MITAVDTNVLIDVFRDDPKFGPKSANALRRCLREGVIVACPIVWAETAAMFQDDARFTEVMGTLGVAFSPFEEGAARQAGAAWRKYRRRGGKRLRVMADFLIAAHAANQCDRLLSRDRGFYKTHFTRLRLLDPSP